MLSRLATILQSLDCMRQCQRPLGVNQGNGMQSRHLRDIAGRPYGRHLQAWTGMLPAPAMVNDAIPQT